jgi:hypothetical protein
MDKNTIKIPNGGFPPIILNDTNYEKINTKDIDFKNMISKTKKIINIEESTENDTLEVEL